MRRLVLASASQSRRTMLANAGLLFESIPASLDERAAEKPLLEAGVAPEDLASALAAVKATMVSEGHPNALVLGADQLGPATEHAVHAQVDLPPVVVHESGERGVEQLWIPVVGVGPRDPTA